MEEQQELERIVNVPCKACGGEMVYDPGQQNLLCKNCGTVKDLPRDKDMVVERSFSEALHSPDQAMGFDVPSKVFHCNGCGANTAVEHSQVAFQCPFCGSTNVNPEAHEAKVIRPAAILPFKVTQQSALEKFKVWIGKGFFAPGNLKRLAQLDKIRSVYLPFWTYDAETFSDWSAESGYYYYTTETYTDSQGNTQTKQVRHTRWVSTGGYHQKQFDDVLVLGSTALDQGTIDKVQPFGMADLVNYDGRFILGHESEVYQKDVEEGFASAENIMDASIRSEISSTVPGDTHRNLRVRTQKSNITFKHILLPIWIAAYTYKGKVFRFVVNGQTGAIGGKKPTSFWKVALVVLLAAAVIGAIVYFASRNG